MLLIGYFEGIDRERGIAWRAADSLALRSFLGVGLKEMPPDHSTLSRTRRLIDVKPIKRYSAGCGVAGREESAEGEDDRSGCDDAGGKCRLALDRTARHGLGLAQESGIATPTREQLAKLDRKRAAGKAMMSFQNSFRIS